MEGGVRDEPLICCALKGDNGLRLPYNDKASKKMTQREQELIDRGLLRKSQARGHSVVEDRPSRAIGHWTQPP